MNIFFIGDTHFGHKNILKFGGTARPFSTIEEHDWELVKRWNSVVGKRDSVYHLGDVSFMRHKMWILRYLNGTKRLVMGNHDQYKANIYAEYFTKVRGVMYIGRKDFVLTHIPVHPSQFNRWDMNIHGHMHTQRLEDKRYFNVACDLHDFTPVPMEEIYKQRKEVYGVEQRKR